MSRLYARKRKQPDYWETTIEVDEVELDPVQVYYEASEPEPDVNWGGDLDVLSVIHKGVDVMPLLSVAELDRLRDDLGDHLNDLGSDDGYGDYLYDRMKDDRLERWHD